MMRGTKSVRAMAKLQSLATTRRSSLGHGRGRDRAGRRCVPQTETTRRRRPSTNRESALHLATAESTSRLRRRSVSRDGSEKCGAAGRGACQRRPLGDAQWAKVPFALPLRLQTTGRANVREGPGAGFKVLFTLETGVRLSPTRTWISGCASGTTRSVRRWIHQTLIDRDSKARD